jgi:hypothetical protein
MSNNFPTFSRISIKILSILVNIVLSIKSLGLDVILFRILTIVRLRFSNVLGRFFSFKNCFTPRVLARKPERAVAFHSGQLHFTAGSCISQRAVAFQSGPDAKNRPALKGSSANQIASFSLIKNK